MTANTKTCIDSYLDSFAHSFAAAHYTAGTIKTYLRLAKKLGQLMDTAGVSPSELTPDLAVQLTQSSEKGSGTTIRLHNLAKQFAQHLINIGVVVPIPLTEAQIARATLLSSYEAYLVTQRGLSPRTIYHALRFANRFLDHRFENSRLELKQLRPSDAIDFVQHLVVKKHPYRDKTVTSHLRAFFQYLFKCGVTSTDLGLSIPKVAKRSNERLPRHLSPEGVDAVLASVGSNPRHSARDYAMLLLMARLGLRAPEVISIQLEDIDWRASELLVRGKGQRYERLPMTAEIGEALSQYLSKERGKTNCREVFITHDAPHRPFKDGQILNTVLKEALLRTGQKPATPFVGSHLLRHSLAVQLVNAGSSLDEVGDVLRHRSRSSTLIYAKLDIDRLRSIAQPWPIGGGQ